MMIIIIIITLRTIAMDLRTSCDEFMESNLVPVDISSLIGFHGVNKVSDQLTRLMSLLVLKAFS